MALPQKGVSHAARARCSDTTRACKARSSSDVARKGEPGEPVTPGAHKTFYPPILFLDCVHARDCPFPRRRPHLPPGVQKNKISLGGFGDIDRCFGVGRDLDGKSELVPRFFLPAHGNEPLYRGNCSLGKGETAGYRSEER